MTLPDASLAITDSMQSTGTAAEHGSSTALKDTSPEHDASSRDEQIFSPLAVWPVSSEMFDRYPDIPMSSNP
jgi:hypothetical protein